MSSQNKKMVGVVASYHRHLISLRFSGVFQLAVDLHNGDDFAVAFLLDLASAAIVDDALDNGAKFGIIFKLNVCHLFTSHIFL